MKFVLTIPQKHKTGPQTYNADLANEIKNALGKWGVVKDDMTRGAAYSLATYLRHKKADVFDPRLFEVTARETDGVGWAVYIRYLGPAPKTIANNLRTGVKAAKRTRR